MIGNAESTNDRPHERNRRDDDCFTVRRKLAQAQRAIDILRQKKAGEPTDHEVADYLEMTLVEYHTLLRDAQCRFALSLHAPTDSDGEQTVLETIPNEETLKAGARSSSSGGGRYSVM